MPVSSCGSLFRDLLFVGFNPGVQVSFIEAPALVQANLAQTVPDNLLFETVARQAAVISSFVEIENALGRQAVRKRIFQVVGYRFANTGKLMKSDGSVCMRLPIRHRLRGTVKLE